MNRMRFGQKVNVELIKGDAIMRNELKFKGKFQIEHIRKGKVINKFDLNNGVVDEGLDAILDIMFHDATKISTWYIGLVDNSGFTGFSSSDTMSSHSGWNESTAYTESNRVEWTEGAASGQSITNSTPVTFNMNATATIKGIFIVSNNTKGGTSGTLWSTAAFASTVSVNNGDQLKITYTLNAAQA